MSQPAAEGFVGLQHMSDCAMAQLKDVLDAFAPGFEGGSRRLAPRRADRRLYTSLFRELLTY